MTGDGRYDGLSRDELITRLTLAERACVMFGWTASRQKSDRDKALHELWSAWVDVVPDTRRMAWPELSDAMVAELAAKRDATRAATLDRIRGDRA